MEIGRFGDRENEDHRADVEASRGNRVAEQVIFVSGGWRMIIEMSIAERKPEIAISSPDLPITRSPDQKLTVRFSKPL